MTEFVDLHCHWVWHIDDGARSQEEGVEMLQKLKRLGFSHVVATPHMRPGMFDNRASDLRKAYDGTSAARQSTTNLPATSLGSEHYFDAAVVEDISTGRGLPYRPDYDEEERRGGAILVEFNDLTAPQLIERKLFDLQTQGFIPVIAHPERYRAAWKAPELVARLIDLGSVALLDVSSLVGKYGQRAQRCAEELLKEGIYDAACTDSHRPGDVDTAEKAMHRVERLYGREELELLFGENPRRLLHGQRPQSA